MSSTGKNILLAGLGKYAATDPSALSIFGTAETIHQQLAIQMSTLSAQGITCHSMDLNPQDPADSLGRVEEVLRSQHFDGIVIGFGLRGNKDNTALFEKVVNLGIEVCGSGVRFGFSTSPTAVAETVERVIPG